MTTFIKDPDAVLDYKIDWSDWLEPLTDTIAASSWTADTGITIDSNSFDDDETVVWLSGGTTGTKYGVTNHITTAGGREDDRTIYIKIREQ